MNSDDDKWPSRHYWRILDVDLPRPRERVKLADDPHYNHLRAEVLKFLYERQRKPEESAIEESSTINSAAKSKANDHKKTEEKAA